MSDPELLKELEAALLSHADVLRRRDPRALEQAGQRLGSLLGQLGRTRRPIDGATLERLRLSLRAQAALLARLTAQNNAALQAMALPVSTYPRTPAVRSPARRPTHVVA